MENYIVSARKYRPMTFDSVVGQHALTQTLKNAVQTGRLAHAYLFCGPRGVGKTTCARIFAKTINCLSPTPTGDACNECESCRAFNEQRSYNIHELDAASNNSVDDIRNLIEQVQIPPQIGRYKVFIVDEVHMLSQSAFNAFLKTLEEPPRHAVFVLATTEKHKILPTILSRCQIYDFSRITLQDTVDHLAYVAQKEGVEADPKALGLIARKADGGMRDALSIFDQVVNFSGGKLTYQAVLDNLNVLDYEYYFRTVDAFIEGNVPGALLVLNEVISHGFDAQLFINGLSSHLRDVMVAKDPVTIPLMDAPADVAARYKQQAERCPLPFLYRALELSNECDLAYRASRNKRLLVEIALIRIAQLLAPQAQQPAVAQGAQPMQPVARPASPQPAPQPQQQYQQPAPQPVPQPQRPQAYPQPQQPQSTVQSPQPPAYPQPQRPQPQQPPQPQQQYQQPQPQYQQPQHPQPQRPQPQQHGGAAAGLRGISIRTAPTQSAEPQGPQEQHTNGAEPVDPDRLIELWKEFTTQIPTETVLINTMQLCLPKLVSPTDFEVEVSTPDQKARLEHMAIEIYNYIRPRLHNGALRMSVRISAATAPTRAFSPREKYQQMLASNPDLDKLREAFGLDLA
jgi:DNA polymerase-3 subunit gamma/tau